MIDIVMPCKEGRYIDLRVLKSILDQKEPIRLFVATSVNTGKFEDVRNNVKKYGETDYVFMLDNDQILPPTGLTSLKNFLDGNPNYAAIAIYRDFTPKGTITEARNDPHVTSSCTLFRREILDSYSYHRTRTCECQHMTDDFREMGHQLGYICGLQTTHITDTDTAGSVEPDFETMEQALQPLIDNIDSRINQMPPPEGETEELPAMEPDSVFDDGINVLKGISFQLATLVNETKTIREEIGVAM